MLKDKINHDLFMQQAYKNNITFAADLLSLGIRKDVNRASKIVCEVYNEKNVRQVRKDLMTLLRDKIS